MRRNSFIGIGLTAVGLFAQVAAMAQPGGGSPQCFDIATSNQWASGDCSWGMICDATWNYPVSGTSHKFLDCEWVVRNCATCAVELVDGVCWIDPSDCSESGPTNVEQCEGFGECSGGGGTE